MDMFLSSIINTKSENQDSVIQNSFFARVNLCFKMEKNGFFTPQLPIEQIEQKNGIGMPQT